ncbi:MAG: hypothetical protein FLDDKLPJ_00965 [Phycisphaerae bacterium]|nr:hypothetical protein [Phycisphaerae bacterium]
MILAQGFPHALHGAEFRTVRRQKHQAQVVRRLQRRRMAPARPSSSMMLKLSANSSATVRRKRDIVWGSTHGKVSALSRPSNGLTATTP